MELQEKIFYSNHAVQQMFQRKISTNEVEYVLKNGEIIKEYPEDNPYPSKLSFAVYEQRPIHVVYSFDNDNQIIVIITVYEPTSKLWEDDFKTRKKQ